MMKTNLSILLVLIVVISSCSTSSKITKCTVPFENRGEITLNRAVGGDGVLLSLGTSDPVALRTLLMQGFQLYLYGKNTDTTIVAFPSAKDVGDKIDHHPGEVKATIQGNQEKRPDMRPLIAALNKADISVSKNGLQPIQLQEGHEVSIDPSNGMLSYSVTIPNDYVINGKYDVTLLSQPDADMNEKGEFDGQGYVSRSAENRPQPFGGSGTNSQTDQRKTITILFEFDK